MRVLHTSDWHLGKKLEGRDRLEEQREVLTEIAGIAEDNGVDLVIAAGDIFDTYTPSAAAEELFYDALMRISGGKRPIVAVSGNHDDPDRLSAATAFAERMGIYIFGSYHDFPKAVKTGMKVQAVKTGRCHVLFEKDNERLYVCALPYPSETRFKEKSESLGYGERVKGWLETGVSGNTENDPCLIVSHFFALGGRPAGEEREIELGGLKLVDKSCIPACAYTALGHLHRKQTIDGDRNIRYSGSVLQYTFGEAEQKSVIIADIDKDGCKNLKEVPLVSGKRLIRIKAEGLLDARARLSEAQGAYSELELISDVPLTRDESRRLRLEFPCLVSLKLNLKDREKREKRGRKELSHIELFKLYYLGRYGCEPPSDVTALYLELMEGLV